MGTAHSRVPLPCQRRASAGLPSTSILEFAKASLNDVQQAQRLRQGFLYYTTVTIGTSETIDGGQSASED